MLSLHHRLAEAHARRIHPVDMPPAVAALHWLRWEREHRSIMAEAVRCHEPDMVDFASDEVEYARSRWPKLHAKARSLRDTLKEQVAA